MNTDFNNGDRVDMTPPGGPTIVGVVHDVTDDGVLIMADGAACYVPTGPLRDALRPYVDLAARDTPEAS